MRVVTRDEIATNAAAAVLLKMTDEKLAEGMLVQTQLGDAFGGDVCDAVIARSSPDDGDDEGSPAWVYAISFELGELIGSSHVFRLDDARRNHGMLLLQDRFVLSAADRSQRVVYALSTVESYAELAQLIGRKNKRLGGLHFADPDSIRFNGALTAQLQFDAEDGAWHGFRPGAAPIDPFEL